MIIAIGIIVALCIIRAKAESTWALTLLGIAALAVGAYLSYSLGITGPIIPILAACVVILLPMLFSSGSSSSSDSSSSYSSNSSSSNSSSNSSSSFSSSTPKCQETASNTSKLLNLDNDYFLIKDGILIEYRGKDDSIFVPRGVRWIGGNDKPIWNKTIHDLYIPDTVEQISDLALPYVESLTYEGPKYRLYYNKEYNFFTNGWVADWSKSIMHPHYVYEVTFDFDCQYYRDLEKRHYAQHPDELLPRKST